jgi:hypothetical protein
LTKTEVPKRIDELKAKLERKRSGRDDRHKQRLARHVEAIRFGADPV